MFSLFAGPALAAHPLITDDTGTQGRGKAQFEFIGEYMHEKEDGVRTNSLTFPMVPVISYGLTDKVDLSLGTSYQYQRTTGSGDAVKVSGLTDTTVDLKWRFFEKNGLSFAMKPGITIPTAADKKELGAGKVTYHLFLIASKELKPLAVHLNLGYARNENTLREMKDLWHTSLAGILEVSGRVKAVANIGGERDSHKESNTRPGFVLGGIIYAVSENVDLDMGVKLGTNRREREYSFPAGITWRF